MAKNILKDLKMPTETVTTSQKLYIRKSYNIRTTAKLLDCVQVAY